MTATQEQNVPALRFPEFSGEWVKSKLGEVIKSYRLGGNYANSELETAFPLIKMGNLSRGSIILGKLEYIRAGETIDESDRICEGDLFFNTRNTLDLVGKVAVWRNELEVAYYNSNIMKLSFEDTYFMNYQLNAPSGIRGLRRIATGTTSVAAIYTKDLLKIWLNSPTLPEQQKIASFLSSVDIRIAQLGRKKQLLQRYKKGCMQKLFSGELRFKDDQGNDFPDWEEKRLGELSKITTGKLDANAMVSDGPYRFYTCAKLHFQIDRFAFDTDALIISGNGANVGYVHHYKGKFNAYQRTYVLDGFLENIFYVKLYLDFFLKRRIGVEKKDGNTPYIVMSTLSEMIVALPCTSEQRKIADFLSAIDRKIDLVAGELDHARTFKKGLLQQMFI